MLLEKRIAKLEIASPVTVTADEFFERWIACDGVFDEVLDRMVEQFPDAELHKATEQMRELLRRQGIECD